MQTGEMEIEISQGHALTLTPLITKAKMKLFPLCESSESADNRGL